MDRQENLVWIPHKSIGGIEFNKALPDGISGIEFERTPGSDGDDGEWIAYRIVGHDSRVIVTDGVVEDVFLWDSFVHAGQELIGATIETAKEIIGGDWTLDEDEEDHEQRFEQDELSISITERNGKVYSVCVSDKDFADE